MPGSRSPERSDRILPASLLAGLLVVLVAGCTGGSPPPAEIDVPVSGVWWPEASPIDSWSPAAAVLLPTEQIVVADLNQNRLYRLRSPQDAPFRLPSPGTPPIEWTALSPAPGLAFYALDGPGRLIHQFDLHGNYLGVALDLDRLSREQGLGSIEPAGMAVDRAGEAVVTDRMRDRVLAFGPGWEFRGEWGLGGSDPVSWRRPSRVAVGERPPYLVADEGNQRVVLLDAFGEILAIRDLAETPRGVAVLEDGRYAVSYGNTVEILGRGLYVERTLALPRAPDCASRSYATTALIGHPFSVWVGEGCSGRLLQISLGGS